MNYIIITIITILLISCRGYQEKSRTEKSQYASLDLVDQFQYGYQGHETDSFGRMWYFQSDSSFHYHADSGITAGSGSLWLAEKGGSRLGFHQFSAQQKQHTKVEEEKERQDQKRVLKAPAVWWIILLVVGVFLYRKLFKP